MRERVWLLCLSKGCTRQPAAQPAALQQGTAAPANAPSMLGKAPVLSQGNQIPWQRNWIHLHRPPAALHHVPACPGACPLVLFTSRRTWASAGWRGMWAPAHRGKGPPFPEHLPRGGPAQGPGNWPAGYSSCAHVPLPRLDSAIAALSAAVVVVVPLARQRLAPAAPDSQAEGVVTSPAPIKHNWAEDCTTGFQSSSKASTDSTGIKPSQARPDQAKLGQASQGLTSSISTSGFVRWRMRVMPTSLSPPGICCTSL